METLNGFVEPHSSNDQRITSTYKNYFQDEEIDKENISPNKRSLEKMIGQLTLTQKTLDQNEAKLINQREKYF